MVVSMQVDVKKQQIIEGGPQGGRITQHTMGSSKHRKAGRIVTADT